jgi:hypothetical protein
MRTCLARVLSVTVAVAALYGAAYGASPVVASTPPTHAQLRVSKPVPGIYYSWYHPSTFSSAKMSDLPEKPYDSTAPSTIQQQINEAAQSGITGFAASWTGSGTQEDKNFAQVLKYGAAYTEKTGTPFVSAIYLETDLLSIYGQTVSGAISYAIKHYMTNLAYFKWKGKPVLFIWDPLGQGRTLAYWSQLRQKLDPKHHEIWMVDSSRPDTTWLAPFDGFFVFSALYWCLPPRGTDIDSCDQTFRSTIDTYNQANGTDKIWAAPAQPGYNDLKLRGTTIGYTVPRSDGATYRTSWAGATSSSPDWVMVTTFNEWYEGTMIEPSKGYHDLYLDLTKKFTAQWRRSN